MSGMPWSKGAGKRARVEGPGRVWPAWLPVCSAVSVFLGATAASTGCFPHVHH